MKGDAIKGIILERWGNEPATKACLAIIDFIITQPEQNSSMLTLGKLGKITKTDATSPTLLKALSLLTSSIDVMTWKFVFFTEDREPYYLNSDDSSRFVHDNTFIDPVTGVDVQDAPKHIYPYLEVNPQFFSDSKQ